MDFEGELHILTETFKKCRTEAKLLWRDELNAHIPDRHFRLILGGDPPMTQELLPPASHGPVIWRLDTGYLLRYLMLPLEGEGGDRCLVIGPYLSARPDRSRILGLGEQLHLPPKRCESLVTYFDGIPCLKEESPLFVMLDVFAERIFGTGRFAIEDLRGRLPDDLQPLEPIRQSDAAETLLKMKLMEERYAAENELLEAVSRGQVHKAASLMAAFEGIPFEKRLDDPLRSMKNYSIIMNTLLRKAAEQSGVHPIDLDRMSSGYAVKIEQLDSEAAVRKLMGEIFRSWCHLVRKYTMKDYSSPVRRAVLMIEADLSADLSLRTLAAAQNINASYLSSLFKKETGKTLTEYINTSRMRQAMSLLERTTLQIQTVALHCGIMDVHYFSRLFRRYTGMTPGAYRSSHTAR